MARATLDDLNRMEPGAFAATLGDVFEHSPWIAEAAYAQRPFATLNALYQAMIQAVRDAGAERQGTLIKSHPDLAGKAAREGALTADSAREQMSAGLDRLSEEEFAAFQRLNEAYRAKFDMPFIVCVRRHGKESILRLFEQRLRHDAATEREAAVSEILRIAALRLDQRVSAPHRLKVHGRLSTHVLDTHRGRPAEGVQIEFLEVFSSGKSRLISRATTNADGRTGRPLVADAPIPIAHYELRFAVGDYFARLGTPAADPPFLGIVPVRFAIAEPEAHYHIPLLVTPWSYATYRGS
jgi:2-oxo-4-hydroxy-4-carboxy-5-ureidoimidazoline decarboxylase